MDIKEARLCADLSRSVYNWDIWGFYLKDHFNCFNKTEVSVRNNQAGLFFHKGVLRIVVRGTESSDWEDMKTNLNCKSTYFSELEGSKVHAGFALSALLLWREISEAIDETQTFGRFKDIKRIVCTGHSLGGAVATLIAAYLGYHTRYKVDLYTFGSPKVFSKEAEVLWSKRYCSHEESGFTRIKHYRFVNNNDIVCKLPLNKLVWKHCGKMYYISSTGKVILPSSTSKTKILFDKIYGRMKAMCSFNLVDGLVDHRIANYASILNKSKNKQINK